MSEPAVIVENVWKRFRKGEIHDSLREAIPALARRIIKGRRGEELGAQEFWALKDVSFEVPKGKSLGIIGPNGAGKSTMLKVLSRILRPNKGTYEVRGRLASMIEVGAGFHGDLTGRENIYLNGAILGMRQKEIRAQEAAIIDFAGVEEFIDTPIKRYSSGMVARLGFAVAAHLDPDVLLVDEVLSVGDARFRNKCLRHMDKLLKSDVTVIFISHILDQVRWLCPQTLVLDHGQVVFNGPTDGAIRKYLDLLDDSPGSLGNAAGPVDDAEIQNVRLCDEAGREVLTWASRRGGVFEFDLVLHKPAERPLIVVNFNTLGGSYIGTASTDRDDQKLTIPSAAGRYRLRFTFDRLPLADGEYTLEFKVIAGQNREQVLWASSQPRIVTVKGSDISGPILLCDGKWEFVPTAAPALDPVRRP